MNNTKDFLKIDFDFRFNTPSRNLELFEPVAINALKDLQAEIANAQQELFEMEDRKDSDLVRRVAERVMANPAGLKGVIRVEAQGKTFQQKAISDAVAAGQTLLTLVDVEMSSTIVFYFMEKDVTRADLEAQAKVLAETEITKTIDRQKLIVKNLTDEMKSLKKAIQMRHAEIKPFSKILAEF